MSRILAIIGRRGAPVERTELERAAAVFRALGPDGWGLEVVGRVGLAHALLRSCTDTASVRQPLRADDGLALVADARVDDRETLCRELQAAGLAADRRQADAELLLQAYRAWGERCVEHLRGDFAFVVWDAGRGRLLAARDQFGVKPLFYADTDRGLLVSNSLRALRAHPAVPDELDRLAIADLLLFDRFQDPAATALAGIRRLPAAHRLTWSGGAPEVARYWSLAVEELIRYRRPDDYVEQLDEVLTSAVGDRIRTPAVALALSGGIDSATVAAATRRVAAARAPLAVAGFTTGYERLIDDDEGTWAARTAEFLGIPIRFVPADDDDVYPNWRDDAYHAAEPGNPIGLPSFHRLRDAIAAHSRVVLTGFGGDPLTLGSSSYYLDRIRRLELGRLLGDVGQLLRMGRRPPLVLGTLWRRWRRKRRALAAYPPWISRGLEAELGLRERWRRIKGRIDVGYSGHRETASPLWSLLFESFDPGSIGLDLEYRHPFFDLRVVTYLLHVPPVPWHVGKLLLRRALAGRAPEAVRSRPKAFFRVDPFDAVLRSKDRKWWLEKLESAPGIGRFVAVERLLEAAGQHAESGAWSFDSLTRPLGLAIWLWHESK